METGEMASTPRQHVGILPHGRCDQKERRGGGAWPLGRVEGREGAGASADRGGAQTDREARGGYEVEEETGTQTLTMLDRSSILLP